MGPTEFLCDIRFHQRLTIPPDPDKYRFAPLHVSYADYGCPDSEAVVLFCGALMASRFCYAHLDHLAKENRVRIIHADRPGVGGTDSIELHQRISTWLAILPPLLSHLNIAHISLASHSGGLLYALNTLLTYPHLLHPRRPYVAFFAPWVHGSHTGIPAIRALEYLPPQVIGKFASIARFVSKTIVPVADLGSAVFHLPRIFASATPRAYDAVLEPSPVPFSHLVGREDVQPGDQAWMPLLRDLSMTYLFAEDVDGIGADAQLFLRKPDWVPWAEPAGCWGDVDEFVKVLLERRVMDAEMAALVVDAFHAEEDGMVGVKGREWFDACWSICSSVGEEGCGEMESRTLSSGTLPETPDTTSTSMYTFIDFKSQTVQGSDHNYILDPALGAAQEWLARVRSSFMVTLRSQLPVQEEDADDLAASSPTERRISKSPLDMLKMQLRHLKRNGSANPPKWDPDITGKKGIRAGIVPKDESDDASTIGWLDGKAGIRRLGKWSK